MARQWPQAQPSTSWSAGASATASAILASMACSSPRIACAVAMKISAIGSVARWKRRDASARPPGRLQGLVGPELLVEPGG